MGIAGTLDQVSLPVFCNSGNMQVTIQTLSGANPSGTVLDSVTFSNGTNQGFVDITLNGVDVSENDQLAIVLSSAGQCAWVRRASGSYSGGSGRFSSNGSNWNALSGGEDLPFSTRVLPLVLDGFPFNPARSEGVVIVPIINLFLDD